MHPAPARLPTSYRTPFQGPAAPKALSEQPLMAVERFEDLVDVSPDDPADFEYPVAEVLPSRDEVRPVIEEAKRLVSAIERSHYDLALLLVEIVAKKVPQALGYEAGRAGMDEFLEAEVGLGRRKAQYLLGIGRTFSRAQIGREQVDAIGWTKAKELIGLPVDQLAEMLDYAGDHTVHEVKERARVLKGRASKARTQHVFRLFEDQNETLEAAFEACQARSGKEDRNVLLDLIAGEWLASQGHRVPLGDMLRLVSEGYGVQVQVVEPPAQ